MNKPNLLLTPEFVRTAEKKDDLDIPAVGNLLQMLKQRFFQIQAEN
jgi:hypothetical protein